MAHVTPTNKHTLTHNPNYFKTKMLEIKEERMSVAPPGAKHCPIAALTDRFIAGVSHTHKHTQCVAMVPMKTNNRVFNVVAPNDSVLNRAIL